MRSRAAAGPEDVRGQTRSRGAQPDRLGQAPTAGHAKHGNGHSDTGRSPNGRRPGGPAGDEFWGEAPAPRGASGSRGSRPGSQAGRLGSQAGRGGAAPAGRDGRYGPGDDDRLASRGTALREPADDFWADGDQTGRSLRSRIAERQFTRGGGTGNGGGNGRGGGYGGGRSRGPDPRSRGERFKQWLLYGRWWRHWTVKKVLAVLGAGIAACFLLGIAGFFILYEMTPVPTASELTANWQSSTVYFANGKQMGTFDDTVGGQVVDRMLLTPGEIPTTMTNAMTAAEDRHFYTEGGVSLTGLMRAAYEDVLGSGNLQGGSTITMQYAKNYYSGVDTGRNLSTKLKEIFIAMKLGRDESKAWVMTNYLNTVPFGPTIDGLGAAAESNFNINLTQPHTTLTIAQAAALAALPNNPSLLTIDPDGGLGYKAELSRWKYVLTNMVRDGNITQAQANEQKFPAYNPPPAGNGETGYTGYLMNMVEQQLEAPYADGGYDLSQQQIDTGGYKIRTTFSLAKVDALARSVAAEKQAIGTAAAQSGGVSVSFRSYDRIGAVLENSKNGDIVAIYGGPGYGSKRCNVTDCDINNAESAEPVGSSFKPYVLAAAVNEGMNVFTSKLNGYSPIWIPLSTAGGNSTTTQLTLSPTHAPPGCNSQPGHCESANGNSYFVFNEADEDSHAPLPVNVAAAISSDPAFEDLAHRDGIQAVINMAQKFGVGQNAFVAPCGASNSNSSVSVAETIKLCNDLTGPGYKYGKQWYGGQGLETNFSPNSTDHYANMYEGTPGSPAIALGENPLTPIEQATTFATLADDGVYHTPTVIESLQQNGSTVPSHLKSYHALSPQAAADVDWALSFDNQLPTGTAYGNVPFDRGYVIGKTGTIGSEAVASEAWFNGSLADEDSLSVALFTNDPGTQNLDNLPYAGGTPGSQGGGWPASLWDNFMSKEFDNQTPVALTTFPEDQGAPFATWIQVGQQHARATKPTCHPGQTQDCTCPPGAQYCAHPNPSPSCQQGFGFGQCSSSPSPTPTCQALGQSCDTPTPSASPSVTPSPTCTPTFGKPCTQAATTRSDLKSPGSSGSSGSSPGGSAASADIVLTAAEAAESRVALALGLVT